MTTNQLPQGKEKTAAVRSMFDAIAPKYELVNRLLTFGLDKKWRIKSIDMMQLQANSLVLDLAAGTGDMCRILEAKGHRCIGVDLSYGMLSNARTNAPLVQADVLQLPFESESVDGVTCGFGLRNFLELPGFFAEVARVLKPGGRIAFLDAYEPTNRFWKTGHSIYFGKVVPKIGGLISGNKDAYEYLPKSLGYLPPIDSIIKSIEVAGFTNTQRLVFMQGASHLFLATKHF